MTRKINSIGFSQDEREEVDEILGGIVNNPLGIKSKKLKPSRDVYSTRYIRYVGQDKEGRPIREQYRFIYAVKPMKNLVIVTKFGDRATVYDDIWEQFDWDEEYFYDLEEKV